MFLIKVGIHAADDGVFIFDPVPTD